MSFILDALKKSESDRQRRSAPGIGDVPDSQRRGHMPRWTWGLLALLALNAVVLAGLWLRPQAESAAALPAPPPAAADERKRSFSSLLSEARSSQPAPPPVSRQAAVDTPPAADPPAARTPAPEHEPAPTPPPAGHPAAAAAEPLPAFNDLRAGGQLTLPDLHLDIHVYADKPADRFVFVNMNKYRERGTLAEGPIVKEITSDGVILEFRDRTFLLPRE